MGVWPRNTSAVTRVPPPLTVSLQGATEMRVANKIRDHMKAAQFRQTDIFHRFDKDGSGQLDARELWEALGHIGLKITQGEVRTFGASRRRAPIFLADIYASVILGRHAFCGAPIK